MTRFLAQPDEPASVSVIACARSLAYVPDDMRGKFSVWMQHPDLPTTARQWLTTAQAYGFNTTANLGGDDYYGLRSYSRGRFTLSIDMTHCRDLPVTIACQSCLTQFAPKDLKDVVCATCLTIHDRHCDNPRDRVNYTGSQYHVTSNGVDYYTLPIANILPCPLCQRVLPLVWISAQWIDRYFQRIEEPAPEDLNTHRRCCYPCSVMLQCKWFCDLPSDKGSRLHDDEGLSSAWCVMAADDPSSANPTPGLLRFYRVRVHENWNRDEPFHDRITPLPHAPHHYRLSQRVWCDADHAGFVPRRELTWDKNVILWWKRDAETTVPVSADHQPCDRTTP